ncbi:MAG: urease subunit gamma [Firmicutes bacterium]|nr:urease subunit gamma [Bacillota bacterium]
MYLSPGDQEKLLLTVAAEVARRRRQRGLKLNVPETVALIADAILEAARDGKSVAECVGLGKQVIGADEVMPEVPEIVRMVQVEATFSDGTKLVTCHDPVGPGCAGWRKEGGDDDRRADRGV